MFSLSPVSSGACNVPQGICFLCGQPGHLKKNYPKLAGISSGGQSSGQPRTVVQGYGRAAGRFSASVRSAVGSSSGNQGAQRPQRTQTQIFTMKADEAQANPDSVTGIITVFGEPAQVLFDFGASRSFISSSCALHADRNLTPLKNGLVVTTPLGERIFVLQYLKGVKF